MNLTVRNGTLVASVERNVMINSIWLPTQRENACGTTSLAYVLRYWGKDVMPDDVDEMIRDDSVADMGTEPLAIVDYAQMQGLHAEIYNNADIEFVKSLIDKGIPVMLLIIANEDTTDVMEGSHWVVAVSYGVVEGEPYMGFYEPNWGQIAISERVIGKYWKKNTLRNAPLWSRLCIAVAPFSVPLPLGDTEGIKAALTTAYAAFQFMKGVDDITDGSIAEGIVRIAGNFGIGVGGGICYGFSYIGDYFPPFKFLGELGGVLLASAGELINDIASLLDFEMMFTDPVEWFKNLGNLFVDILQGIGDFFKTIGQAIANFFRAIGKFFKKLGCKLFGRGCPKEVVKWKHALSLDPCGEAKFFINGFARTKPIGYLLDESFQGSVEIYLYGKPIEIESIKTWNFYLIPGGVSPGGQYVMIGFLGYSNMSNPGGYRNLTEEAENMNMYLGGVDGVPDYSLGFIPVNNSINGETIWNATILWEMEYVENRSIKLVSLDPCLHTRTFLYTILKGYSRDMVIGYVFYDEAPGTVPLYRFYNTKTENFYSSINPEPEEGYTKLGIIGYIYPPDAPKPEGTTELWSFWNKKSKDHMESVDPEAEGKEGYEMLGLLGYICENYRPCTTPLWRYCLRYVVKE